MNTENSAADTGTVLNMVKGQKIDLTKGKSLTTLHVGMGWNPNASKSSNDFDLDAFALALVNGKMGPDASHILFFNSPKFQYKPEGATDTTEMMHILGEALIHSGDNLTGDGDGDDETLIVQLGKLPADVDQVLLCCNIYQAAERKQNFGMVDGAFMRIYNPLNNNEELAKFDLNEDYSAATGVVFGKLYRNEAEWKFQALGTPHTGSINDFAADYRK